jgi:hypothetical protein
MAVRHAPALTSNRNHRINLLSRIGSLKPIDVQTPHGSVRILSRYRSDKKHYRLMLYGPAQAVQWMLPTRTVETLSTGMAQVEVSRPERPITTIPALDQFCRELLYRWQHRLELGPDDPAFVHLQSKGLTVAANTPTTLGALVTQFLSAQAGHVRPKTLREYKKILIHWQHLIPASTSLAALSADMIRKAMQILTGKRSSPLLRPTLGRQKTPPYSLPWPCTSASERVRSIA